MPRARALRSTLEIPPRFSTATAMTSTPRVIQFSTSSFWRAASRLVGPSQIRSTPSSRAASSAPARQLTKYGSPFAFGIMATTGRLAADAGVGRDRRRLVRRRDRSHEPHVRAGNDQRSRDDRSAQHGNLAVSSRLSPPRRRARRRHIRVRARSMAMVTSSNVPVSTPVSSDGSAASCSPFRSTDKANRPSSVPQSVPRPPKHRRAAQHHRRDRVELVSRPGVRSRLSEMRDVDDRRHARHQRPTAGTRAPTRRSTGMPAYRAPAAVNPMA